MPALTAPALTQSQVGALAKIACGIEAGSGIALLCGPSGVGKTTVLEHLAAELSADDHDALPVHDVSYWLGTDDDLPRAVLADDAHTASEADLIRLAARCRARRPSASLVLAGQGRLLTLVSRDRRLEQATRITAAILPGEISDTEFLVQQHSAAAFLDDATMLAMHEIAGGVPADIVRLLDLALVVAESDQMDRVSADAIETIHRRLSPRAA